MKLAESVKLIEQRRDSIEEWLNNEAPFTAHDQKHLDAHSPEQAYWHYGFKAACDDLLEAMERVNIAEEQ